MIAYSVLRSLGFSRSALRVRDIGALVLITTVVSTPISATLGSAVFVTVGHLALPNLVPAWFIYWIANATACLTLTGLILSWARPFPGSTLESELRARKLWLVEACCLCLILVALSLWIWLADTRYIFKLEYLLFPLLAWSSIRFGIRVTMAVIATVTFAAVWGTAHGLGPFGADDLMLGLVLMQMYVAVYAIGGQLLAAFAEERLESRAELYRSKNSLEATVKERTEAMAQANAYLNGILNSVSSAIVACDTAGRLTLMNRATTDQYGPNLDMAGPEEWSQRFMLYRPGSQQQLAEADIPLMRALNGEKLSNDEFEVHVPGKPTRTILVSGQPIAGPDHRSVGAVVVAHDITSRKRAEDLERLVKAAALASNEAPDEEQAILTILEAISASIRWPLGHALRVEDTSGGAVAIATPWWHNSAGDDFSIFQTITEQMQFHADEDLPGKVLATKKDCRRQYCCSAVTHICQP